MSRRNAFFFIPSAVSFDIDQFPDIGILFSLQKNLMHLRILNGSSSYTVSASEGVRRMHFPLSGIPRPDGSWMEPSDTE